MAILVFAGVLSVPSAVFAEASWYGSLRAGVDIGGGQDARLSSAGSRVGIRGSAEAGEGLTAVYRFENAVNTANAGWGGGRLGFVGLSGGFGSLTLGQIWSASYNHAGSITDKSTYFGDAGTSYRHGNVLSYAYSAGAVGFQVDLISNGGMDTGKAIDKSEFGMTIGLGEMGRVAIAHTNIRDQHTTKMVDVSSSAVAGEAAITLGLDDGVLTKTFGVWRDKTTRAIVEDISGYTDVMHTTGTGAAQLSVSPLIVYGGSSAPTGAVTMDDDGNYRHADCVAGTAVASCTKYAVWVSTTNTAESTAGEDPTATYAIVDAATVNHTATAILPDMKRGSKSTHVAVEFGIGGITPYIGYSESKENGATAKSKTTHYGVSGGLGDTGMSYLVAARSIKSASGTKSSPWLVNVSRSLGGGASVVFEHINKDDGNSGTSRVGLHVGF